MAVLLVTVMTLSWLAVSHGAFSTEALEALLQGHPVLAPLLFVVAHVAAAMAFLPCSPFTLIAGFMWPQPFALLLSVFAALCASSATFLFGRHLMPAGPYPGFINKPLQHLRGLSTSHGWSIVVFTFLNPALPSSTLGYVFGLSAISFRTYVWGALIAMLPLQVALVTLGSAARQALLSGVGLMASVFAAVAAAALGMWFMLRHKADKSNLNGKEGDGDQI